MIQLNTETLGALLETNSQIREEMSSPKNLINMSLMSLLQQHSEVSEVVSKYESKIENISTFTKISDFFDFIVEDENKTSSQSRLLVDISRKFDGEEPIEEENDLIEIGRNIASLFEFYLLFSDEDRSVMSEYLSSQTRPSKYGEIARHVDQIKPKVNEDYIFI